MSNNDPTSVLLRELAHNVLRRTRALARQRDCDPQIHMIANALGAWLRNRAPLLPGHEEGWNIDPSGFNMMAGIDCPAHWEDTDNE